MRVESTNNPFVSLNMFLDTVVPCILCLTLAVLFVGVLYLAPTSISKLDRDDPKQIYWRFQVLTVVAAICPFFVAFGFVLSPKSEPISVKTLYCSLGLLPDDFVRSLVIPTLVTLSLFLGPLMEKVFWNYREGSAWRVAYGRGGLTEALVKPAQNALDKPTAVRAYLFAPIVEEWVFRSCMVSILLRFGFSTSRTVLLAPLYFGVAHLHHGYRMVHQDGVPLRRAILIVFVQFAYTSLFGAYATFVFCRTHNFYAIALQHSICNYMGFPQPGWMNGAHPLNSKKTILGASYILGIGLFYFGMSTLFE